MEDRFANYIDVKHANYFFGVYDGHAGSNTAQQLSETLHFMVKQHPNYKHGDIPGAAQDGFIEMDTQLNADQKLTEDISGSTAVLLILDNNNAVGLFLKQFKNSFNELEISEQIFIFR